MSNLRIAKGMTLPVDVAGEAIAILAKRGAGKTHTASVLVEELHGAGVQVVVLDPVGAWWGLRSSADGKGEGLPFARLGGTHADVPLEPTAGALIADVAVDTEQPLVVDLSEFSKTQMRRFVTDFAERLYRRKAGSRSLLHLVLEEADVFAPQRVRGVDDGKMQSAIEAIVRRGRGRGLGITMITQRSAVLSKDVLEQADVLVVLRITGPRDRDAIEGWIGRHAEAGGELVLPTLPSLPTGEAWFWNPEREILTRTKVRPRRTFDSSDTPKVGERRREPKAQASIDLEALGEEIRATADRAKENDPKELRRRIHELERRVRDEPLRVVEEKEIVVEKVVEVTVVSDAQIEFLRQVGREAQETAARLGDVASEILNQISAASLRGAVGTERATGPQPRAAAPAPRREARPRTHKVARSETVRTEGGVSGSVAVVDVHVSGPQQRILNALAQLEAIGVGAPRKVQLALFAEASPKSSSYTNNLGHLRTHGLVDYPAGGRVCLTAAGRALADAGAAPSTTEELHAYVAQLVGPARWRLLEQLILWYDAPISKEELAERAGASATSSSFTNNLGSLRSLGLIDYPEPGHVVAKPVLFLEPA